MITGSINLTAVQKVGIAKVKEQECLIIPIEANNLEKDKNGNVYLSFVAWENKTPNDFSTHGIKQSFKKEIREKMSKEEQYAQKFLGNLKVTGGFEAAAPEVSSELSGDGGSIDASALPF